MRSVIVGQRRESRIGKRIGEFGRAATSQQRPRRQRQRPRGECERQYHPWPHKPLPHGFGRARKAVFQRHARLADRLQPAAHILGETPAEERSPLRRHAREIRLAANHRGPDFARGSPGENPSPRQHFAKQCAE